MRQWPDVSYLVQINQWVTNDEIAQLFQCWVESNCHHRRHNLTTFFQLSVETGLRERVKVQQSAPVGDLRSPSSRHRLLQEEIIVTEWCLGLWPPPWTASRFRLPFLFSVAATPPGWRSSSSLPRTGTQTTTAAFKEGASEASEECGLCNDAHAASEEKKNKKC